jgi:hypothetical protein
LFAKLQVAAALVAFALPLAGQDAESQIRSLREKPMADSSLPNFKAITGELMKRVRDAAAGHRVFQSLENLAQTLPKEMVGKTWSRPSKLRHRSATS